LTYVAMTQISQGKDTPTKKTWEMPNDTGLNENRNKSLNEMQTENFIGQRGDAQEVQVPDRPD